MQNYVTYTFFQVCTKKRYSQGKLNTMSNFTIDIQDRKNKGTRANIRHLVFFKCTSWAEFPYCQKEKLMLLKLQARIQHNMRKDLNFHDNRNKI